MSRPSPPSTGECLASWPSTSSSTTMDALPDMHMRRVHDVDFCSQELEIFLPNLKRKIGGTTLDAFAAVVQASKCRRAFLGTRSTIWVTK